MLIMIYHRQFFRLTAGVTGPCGVCDDCDVHDHFDRDLRELICAGCAEETRVADDILRFLCVPGVVPLDANTLAISVRLFSRGRPISI